MNTKILKRYDVFMTDDVICMVKKSSLSKALRYLKRCGIEKSDIKYCKSNGIKVPDIYLNKILGKVYHEEKQ